MGSAVTGTGSTTGNGDGITATVTVVDETGEPGGKKKKTTKRRKVNHACLYCRRSHMTCDVVRGVQARTVSSTSSLATIAPAASTSTSASTRTSTTLPYLMQPAQTQPSFYYGTEFGSEFSVLSDFLETLDDATFFSAPPPTSSLNNPTASPSLMFASCPGLGGSSTLATTAPLLGTVTSTRASSAGTSATTTATTAAAGAGTTANTTHTHTPSSSDLIPQHRLQLKNIPLRNIFHLPSRLRLKQRNSC
ncbi:Transcription factor [Stygiomarasmius scandens]|uniref:Transcription factor n=1 Tax=Marasmiellus scandens TaxID=2682957 RepID=A0ABR1J9G5_9AGAR